METLQLSNNFHFNCLGRRPRVNSGAIQAWLVAVAESEKKEILHINYNFCSDEYLLGINRVYLNHNYYTDIITFDLSEPSGKIEADIYISVDRVKDNALALGVEWTSELNRVMVHGILHLLGYKG